MRGTAKHKWIVWGLFLAAVTVLSGSIWRAGYVNALAELQRRGAAELALASDGLKGRLERYRELAVVLADHPTLRPVLTDPSNVAAADALLLDVADKTGSLNISVVNTAGQELAAARPRITRSLAGDAYFERAMDGALGVAHFYAQRFGERAFVFGAPMFSADGPVEGAIVVIASGEAVEAAWRGDRPALFFTDTQGVVFLSNRSELVFRSRGRADGAGQSFAQHQIRTVAGHQIWDLDAGRYLPQRALHLSLPLPGLDMVGEVLIDVAPAQRLAVLQALVAAGLCLSFGAVLVFVSERRRRLADLNQALEGQVARRTAALEKANRDLRHEVEFRSAAEDRLKQAQAELVQAGKLSALGQMSAGISHELNQPLMAIRSFAENGQAFLERGKPDVAGENLGRISELARRMGRIIQNLRAFARQEEMPMSDVDIVAIIDDVVEMASAKAKTAGVVMVWTPPAVPVWVRGGEVRLQQVLTNLVGNAIDAMEEAAQRRLQITLDAGARVVVAIRDTGPGIAVPDKIFEPFFTTKAVGAAEGMGLGLSISYGIVQSFGGKISGQNHPDGGAVFTIELEPSGQKDVA